jgi:hypothetical protein
VHWRFATAPGWVAPASWWRSFNPLVRISQRFAAIYALMMADSDWFGHYEFTLPTAAVVSGSVIEDIGGASDLTPAERRGRNYTNTPWDHRMKPGTFVWRPPRAYYFHERPETFEAADMLYHPVKVDG